MAFKIKNISKRYAKNKIALDDVSITIEKGILGLLGSNGAGKSTFLSIVSTLQKPSSGSILYEDMDIIKKPNALRKVLGYLPQDFGVYPNLNAYEYLEYIAALKGVSSKGIRNRIIQLLERLNLITYASEPLHTYSGGMKQRIGIAQALLNNPEVLILDEPTVGLDPEQRLEFVNLLSDLSSDRIIILSTHIISDIERIADTVAVLKKGHLLVHEEQSAMLNMVDNLVFQTEIAEDRYEDFKKKYRIVSVTKTINSYQIRYIDAAPKNRSLKVFPRLEDAFVHLN